MFRDGIGQRLQFFLVKAVTRLIRIRLDFLERQTRYGLCALGDGKIIDQCAETAAKAALFRTHNLPSFLRISSATARYALAPRLARS